MRWTLPARGPTIVHGLCELGCVCRRLGLVPTRCPVESLQDGRQACTGRLEPGVRPGSPIGDGIGLATIILCVVQACAEYPGPDGIAGSIHGLAIGPTFSTI